MAPALVTEGIDDLPLHLQLRVRASQLAIAEKKLARSSWGRLHGEFKRRDEKQYRIAAQEKALLLDEIERLEARLKS